MHVGAGADDGLVGQDLHDIGGVPLLAAAKESLQSGGEPVLLDVDLPDGSGVEACREIRTLRPDTKVLILTSHADRNALAAGDIAENVREGSRYGHVASFVCPYFKLYDMLIGLYIFC